MPLPLIKDFVEEVWHELLIRLEDHYMAFEIEVIEGGVAISGSFKDGTGDLTIEFSFVYDAERPITYRRPWWPDKHVRHHAHYATYKSTNYGTQLDIYRGSQQFREDVLAICIPRIANVIGLSEAGK